MTPIFGHNVDFYTSWLLSVPLPVYSLPMGSGPDVKHPEDADYGIFGANEFIPDSDQVRCVRGQGWQTR
jgi:hypothetical protein